MSTFQTDQQQRETEQVTGTLTGIVQKGPDKWQAVVAPDGSQYTKNLWTKDAGLIQSLSQAIGQRLAFLCNVSHWTNNSGQPVRSLWIEVVGPSAVGSPALAGPPMVQPQGTYMDQGGAPVAQPPMPVQQPQPPAQDDREQKIHRQTASKVAAIMLSHVAPEERTMSTLFVLAERLVAYYGNGLPNPETLDQLMQRAVPNSVDEGPPHTDDDIPF